MARTFHATIPRGTEGKIFDGFRLSAQSAACLNLLRQFTFNTGMMLNVVTAFVLTFTLIDLGDPAVHGVFKDLLRSARWGCSNEEQAAFLIRNSTGATFFLRWRSNGELNRAEWDGPIPAGTIAIIHTHPNWLPLPSRRDGLVARHASVPVYVITRTRIARTDGGEPVVLIAGDWSGP